VDDHASFDGSSKNPRKNMLPVGSRVSGEFFIMKQLYNTFLVKIKALWHCESVAAGPSAAKSLTMVNIYN
jgi:hypothetical protein